MKFDPSRRGAFKAAGGIGLGALLAPLAGKITPKVPVPAFAPPPILGSRPHSFNPLQAAAYAEVDKITEIVEAVFNARHHRERASQRRAEFIDHDIRSLRSVQPWAKGMMQRARDDVYQDLIDQLEKLQRGKLEAIGGAIGSLLGEPGCQRSDRGH